MTRRSYQQFCPIAYTLDVIGERWTLLIVRELSLGPRRFSDLQRGLPGIGPNLLSSRLKELEQADVIVRQYLPPPAKLMAYTLTERGESLLQAMAPLSRWGIRYLTMPPPPDDFLSAVAAASALYLLFVPETATKMTAEIHLLPDIFSVTITGSQLQVELGSAVNPALIFHTSPKVLLGIVSQLISTDEALSNKEVSLVQGNAALLNHFVGQFKFITESKVK